MLTNISSGCTTSTSIFKLINISVRCPSCDYYYSAQVSSPISKSCNDKKCVVCKIVFKVRYNISDEECKSCKFRVRCVGIPVADIKETVCNIPAGEINWST